MREEILGGKYRILKEIGRGGGGQVFQVYDCRLHKLWAAKKVENKNMGMEERILQLVEGICFVRIVDVIQKEDVRFLIMDWVEGESLQQKIDRQKLLEPKEAIQIGIGVCRALEQLHAMEPPILHLDCKPSNIMLAKDGRIVLVDFGSAVLCQTGQAVPFSGSIGYAAPEQRQTKKELRCVDVRSDVYGLGRTLYAMLTGLCPDRPPYGMLPPAQARAGLSPGICSILEKSTAHPPGQRFQTVAAFRQALEHFEKEETCSRRLLRRGLGLMAVWAGAGLSWFLAQKAFQGQEILPEITGAAAVFLGLWLYKRRHRARKPQWEMGQSILRTMKNAGQHSRLLSFYLFLAAFLLKPF